MLADQVTAMWRQPPDVVSDPPRTSGQLEPVQKPAESVLPKVPSQNQPTPVL